jgi:argininosuccinate lyase
MEMFERDCGRLGGLFPPRQCVPAGQRRHAGSTLPLDREMVATMLGFVDHKGRRA